MSDEKPPVMYVNATHITGKPDNPSPDGKPGGASGSGSNWTLGFGSGGGSGFFSGGFGGSSRKKAKRRARARKRAAAQQRAEAEARARAQADAQAQAQAQAEREAAHRQLIQTLTQTYSLKKSELDQVYVSRLSTLSELLAAELAAAKKRAESPGVERWQLYLISKEKSEVDSLASRKESELRDRNLQALSFNGRDPSALDPQTYQETLTHSSNNNSALAHEVHNRWEASYVAVHEAKVLAESIRILAEKS